MKRRLVAPLLGAFTGLVIVAALVAPALADSDDYYNNPGRDQAIEVGAQCGTGAGSGAFGYLGGHDNNLGINSDPNDPGANGAQTGLNNSNVCGNRQGNLP